MANRERSQQKRFDNPEEAGQFWSSLRGWVSSMAKKPVPQRKPDTRELDRWLSEFWECEPYLAGMLDQVCMIHANRGWSVMGGKRLVDQFTRKLHGVEGGRGWRYLKRVQALSYLTSNFGGTVEIGRSRLPRPMANGSWRLAPVESLYSMDPTLCRLRNDPSYPLEYDNVRDAPWSCYDYYSVVSMPSNREPFFGSGTCPLYRCVKLAQITSGLFDHMNRALNPDKKQGFLSIFGLSFKQFMGLIRESKAANRNDNVGMDEMGDYVILADNQIKPEMELLQLTRIPEGVDITEWANLVWIGYAMNLGFQPEEFIGSHNNTLLGQSGAEVAAGERRASSKGGGDFILQDQEMMQRLVVPERLHWEYMERDPAAEFGDVEVVAAKAQVIRELFEAVSISDIDEGERIIDAQRSSPKLLSVQEARRWAVEWGVMPKWITAEEENVTESDVGQLRMKRLRDEAMGSERFRRSLEYSRDEPVVQYKYWVDVEKSRDRDDYGRAMSSTVMLWSSGAEALRPMVWPVEKRIYQERADVSLEEPLYAGEHPEIDDDERESALALVDEQADEIESIFSEE